MQTRLPSRRTFLKTAGAGVTALGFSCKTLTKAAKETGSRPNVILIMTDDQGYGDLGTTGNPVIRTPNIDRMAERSGSLANFYVSPVCAPTRASLMTGRYNYRTRCIDTYIGRAMMDTEETTVAEILADAGYATGIFGKWHLGDSYPMRPIDQGFEEALVHRGGGIGQPSDPPGGEGKYTDPILFHNGKEVKQKGYCTDVYFDAALDWIQNCRSKNRNFFAYIPTNAPHGPFHDVPEALLKEYKEKDLNNSRFPQQKGHKLPDKSNTDKRARIYAMITNVDENVGRLFRKLEALKLLDNTVVMFMVDNGPNGRRYVAGMRGWKSQVYEGGTHSPFFVHWSGVVKAGHSSDHIAAHIDLLPTILDACNVKKPEGLKLDGRSLLPLLTGRPGDWPDRMIVIQSHRGDKPVRYHNFSARTQKWKLLHASGFGKNSFQGEPHFELYDMENDPLETKNVAPHHPEIVETLRKQYDAWFDDVSSTRPDNYEPPRIHIGTPHENPVVLTRQDWRHIKGRPWGADSNGFWLLYAAKKGPYTVRLRFPPLAAPADITLEFGGKTLNQSASQNDTECTFKEVPVDKGEAKLLATLTIKEKTRGPWQVDVMR